MTQSSISSVLAYLRTNAEHQGAGLSVMPLNAGAIENAWQQLLPAGFFRAVDGRPHDVPTGQWYLDGAIAARLIQEVKSRTNDLVIDYEHQTLHSEYNGKPAPAAGWFKEIEWREGSGLWIKPTWTRPALDHIRNGEYRYLSAVFPYDSKTGIPRSLHSAALVNNAGIDGMAALVSLSSAMAAASAVPKTEQPGVSIAALSVQEKALIDRLYVHSSTYLDKREAYCRKRGVSWAQLTALTPEGKQVIKRMGLDEEAYRASSLQILVDEILRSG